MKIKEITINNKEIICGMYKGNTYVNTTPHSINFGVGDDILILPTSGIIINSRVEEKEVAHNGNGINYVTTRFTKTLEDEAIIKSILDNMENVVIIGSIIAAQAYTECVVALTPCKGFERVPPAEKRMNIDKFTMFYSESYFKDY